MLFSSDAHIIAFAMAANGAIGLYVFVKNPCKQQHIAFYLSCTANGYWALNSILFYKLRLPEFAAGEYAGIALYLICFVWFAYAFVGTYPAPSRKALRFGYLAISLSIFAFSYWSFHTLRQHPLHIPHLVIVGPFLSLSVTLFTARLLLNKEGDLRRLVQRGMIYALLISLMTVLYLLLLLISNEVLDETKWFDPPLSAAIALLIGLATIPSLEHYFERITRAFFFGVSKEYEAAVEEGVAARTKYLSLLQEQQRQFFDDISHALQTPVTVLKSSIESLYPEASNASRPEVAMLLRSVTDLSELIRDLLKLARLNMVPEEREQGVLDLSALVQEVADYIQVLCRNHDISLICDIAPALYILGNRKQLHEAFANILSNAIRYTSGCPVRSLEIRLEQTAGFLVLAVADTGVGIPADQLPHIFERFYRADTEKQVRGCGLGLAIAKSIVDRHRGSMEVESAVGKGTTFTLRFPAFDGTPAPESRLSDDGPGSAIRA